MSDGAASCLSIIVTACVLVGLLGAAYALVDRREGSS